MGVRIDIGLDHDGNHKFAWQPSDDPRALHVPEAILKRWSAERLAFSRATARWQSVVREIDEFLFDGAAVPMAGQRSGSNEG